MATQSPALLVRWMARLCSLVSALILLMFIVGELSAKGPGPSGNEWLGLTFFPLGVIAGVIFSAGDFEFPK